MRSDKAGSEKADILEQFLSEVDEQIAYRPMHAAVNEELRAHVEDKAQTYMEYGLDEEEAYKKAVRDMGDASALGIQMNDTHHLRVARPLLGLILLLVAFGIAGNLMARGFDFYEILYNSYFVWGILVLWVVMRYGYPLLLKHADKIFVLFLAAGGVFLIWRIAGRILIRTSVLPALPYALYSPSVVFGILQLSIPAAVLLMYRRRHKGVRGLWPVFLFLLFMVYVSISSYMAEYTYIPILTLFGTCLGVVIYMTGKGYLTGEKKKGLAVTLLSFVLLLALWVGVQGERFSENLQRAVHPESQATSAWTDAYNNVLIRNLLGRAELTGKIRLSEEELVRYGTSEWYYSDGPGIWKGGSEEAKENFEQYVSYRMQFLEEPGLAEILPQHYLNNYRFAWWILEAGWIPGIFWILLNLAVYILMFHTALHIRNRLARLMAFAGSLALSIQFLFYLLGNFGVQFGAFGNLPFVSEGWVSITGTMIMAGLILSAYRFDTVMKESVFFLQILIYQHVGVKQDRDNKCCGYSRFQPVFGSGGIHKGQYQCDKIEPCQKNGSGKSQYTF